MAEEPIIVKLELDADLVRAVSENWPDLEVDVIDRWGDDVLAAAEAELYRRDHARFDP